MITKLGDDDLGDQRLCRQAAGHDVFGCMRLCDRRRAAPASIFRPPGDEHAQLCRDQVEPLRDVLADSCHLATAAGAKDAVRLDDALHPRQMGGQLATVAVTGRSASGRFGLDGGLGSFLCSIENALGDLHVLKRQVALIGAQLLGFGAELVAPEFADDDLEPAPSLFHLSQSRLMLGEGGLRLRQKRLQPGILCEEGGDIHAPLQSQIGRPHYGGKRARVIPSHSAGKLRRTALLRPHQPPVQALEQGRKLRRRQTHDAIAHLRPDELAALQPLVDQHQAGAVPDQDLEPVGPLRSEHEHGPAEGILADHLLHRHSEPVMAFAKVDRPRCDIDLQMRIRRDHRAARTMRMIRHSCSPSTPGSARMTTSPTIISMQRATSR